MAIKKVFLVCLLITLCSGLLYAGESDIMKAINYLEGDAGRKEMFHSDVTKVTIIDNHSVMNVASRVFRAGLVIGNPNIDSYIYDVDIETAISKHSFKSCLIEIDTYWASGNIYGKCKNKNKEDYTNGQLLYFMNGHGSNTSFSYYDENFNKREQEEREKQEREVRKALNAEF